VWFVSQERNMTLCQLWHIVSHLVWHTVWWFWQLYSNNAQYALHSVALCWHNNIRGT